MKKITFVTALLFVVAGLLSSCKYDEIKDGSSSSEYGFTPEVKAIVQNNCVKCHGGGNSSGGFSVVDNPDQLVAQGYVLKGSASTSKLYMKLTGEYPGNQMPYGGPYLSATDLAYVAKWINSMTADSGFPPATVSFQNDIRPILERDFRKADDSGSRYCATCHNATKSDTGTGSGYRLEAMADDLTLDYNQLYGKVNPGNPLSSILYKRLAGLDGLYQMPKDALVENYLSTSELKKVYDWIDQGALDN